MTKRKYWFKAKTYGWGWTPATWQGWLVFIGFFVVEMVLAFSMGIFYISEINGAFDFLILSTVLALLLIFICYLTGEKLQWKWGKKK